MTILRVIVEEVLAPAPSSVRRYSEELTRELVAAAPRGCSVEGVVAASTNEEYELIERRIPGLARLHRSALAHRELVAAWQHGFTRIPGRGMLHAPSLLAPLSRHDRLNDGDQAVVTAHETIAWSNPDSLSAREVAWHKAMLKRAHKYADAIVVPSHTVAAEVAEIAEFGERIRVIGGAPSSALGVPGDAQERAERLDLPERYVLAIGDLAAFRGIDQLIRAMASVGEDAPLLIVGIAPDDAGLAAAIAAADLPEGRVRGLGVIPDPDLAVVIDRATVFVHPALEEGFGMPVLEAFALGTPVVHSDAPALLELGADSALVVERGSAPAFQDGLAEAITSVLTDSGLAERLRYLGQDRSRAFTWRTAAEKVWQLHADL